jgi:hypothetical protein
MGISRDGRRCRRAATSPHSRIRSNSPQKLEPSSARCVRNSHERASVDVCFTAFRASAVLDKAPGALHLLLFAVTEGAR